MEAVSSAHFEMTRAGAPITVEGLVFDRAVGRYAAPAAAEAVLSMHAGDVAVELGTISMDEHTWITDPITGRWHELRLGSGFNPAVLFDPAVGLGGPAHRPPGRDRGRPGAATPTTSPATIPAARVEAITAGLAAAQEVALDMWLDASTLHIVRLEFSTDGADGRSDWVIVMSDFGAPVQIDPPAAG